MTLDVKMRAKAKELIERFGKLVTIRRTTKSAYDPGTGTGGDDNTPVDYPVYITPPFPYKEKNADGTVITTDELEVSIADLDAPITPDKETDTIIIDGTERRITDHEQVWSGELVCMHTLRLSD